MIFLIDTLLTVFGQLTSLFLTLGQVGRLFDLITSLFGALLGGGA